MLMANGIYADLPIKIELELELLIAYQLQCYNKQYIFQPQLKFL